MLLHTVLGSGLGALGGDGRQPAGLIAGPDAFDAWIESLDVVIAGQRPRETASIAHAAFTRRIVENRRSAVRYLQSVMGQTTHVANELMNRLTSELAHTAGALRMLCDAGQWAAETSEVQGLSLRSTSIRRAQASDRAAIDTIRQLQGVLRAETGAVGQVHKI
jgi:hypothetical protein